MHTYMHTDIHMYTFSCMYMCVHLYIYVCIYIYIHMYTCIYIQIYRCVWVFTPYTDTIGVQGSSSRHAIEGCVKKPTFVVKRDIHIKRHTHIVKRSLHTVQTKLPFTRRFPAAATRSRGASKKAGCTSDWAAAAPEPAILPDLTILSIGASKSGWFLYVTWLIHMCDVNDSYSRNDALNCRVYRNQNCTCALLRGGGLGSRPKKMYGERLGDGVEYHLMKPTPRR